MLAASLRRAVRPCAPSLSTASTQLRAFGGAGGTGRESLLPSGSRIRWSEDQMQGEWTHFPTWHETGKGNQLEPSFQERGRLWTRGKNLNANVERLWHWLPGDPKEYPMYGRCRMPLSVTLRIT